jgi:hypothetical protein
MGDEMTDTEALILLNQSMILTGLSALLSNNKELSDLMLTQAHTAGNRVMYDDKTRQSCGSC